MHGRYARLHPEDELSCQPVTMSSHYNTNGNGNGNGNGMRKDRARVKSKEKVKMGGGGREREGDWDNEQLIGELCQLLAKDNVQDSMTGELYQRVEKVLAAAARNKNKNARPALRELSSNLHNSNEDRQPKQKTIQAATEDHESPSQNSHPDFYPWNTFSIQKPTPHKPKHPQKQPIPQNNSSKTIKPSKSVKTLTESKSNGRGNKVQTFVLGQKGKAKGKGKGEERKVSESNSLAKRGQGISRNPSSLSITAFTARNQLNEKSKSREKEKVRSKSKGRPVALSNQSTGKLSKFQTNVENYKKNSDLRRIYTEQDYQHIMLDNSEQDEQLFSNPNPGRTKTQPDPSSSLQFLQHIHSLQTSIQTDQQTLLEHLKQLKSDLSTQKSLISTLNTSISSLQKQQSATLSSLSSLEGRKKQLHKKLELTWNEVKGLNAKILDIRERNQEIVANIGEERELVLMYGRVMEEIKEQLKIQMEERDQYKRMLKYNRKLENVSRIKMATRKEKNETMLGNLRDSINKWIA